MTGPWLSPAPFGAASTMGCLMGDRTRSVPTRELVRLDASQAQLNQSQYAAPVGWAPAVEDEMVNNVIRMVQRILD